MAVGPYIAGVRSFGGAGPSGEQEGRDLLYQTVGYDRVLTLARLGVLCTFGTLDSDYRGELMVALYTTSPEVEYTIGDGDRIAQLVITSLAEVTLEEAAELDETLRGAGGHGSTGR